MRSLFPAFLILAVALTYLAAQPRQIPENPCGLLAPEQLAVATGLQVVGAERKPDILELVRAQEEKRPVAPGRVCVYKTQSVFGDIVIGLPLEQDSAIFRQDRDTYFAEFPGSAKPIPNLGLDAFLAGGASLRLLVRDDLQIGISSQNSGKAAEELLIRIARRILAIYG